MIPKKQGGGHSLKSAVQGSRHDCNRKISVHQGLPSNERGFRESPLGAGNAGTEHVPSLRSLSTSAKKERTAPFGAVRRRIALLFQLELHDSTNFIRTLRCRINSSHRAHTYIARVNIVIYANHIRAPIRTRHTHTVGSQSILNVGICIDKRIHLSRRGEIPVITKFVTYIERRIRCNQTTRQHSAHIQRAIGIAKPGNNVIRIGGTPNRARRCILQINNITRRTAVRYSIYNAFVVRAKLAPTVVIIPA